MPLTGSKAAAEYRAVIYLRGTRDADLSDAEQRCSEYADRFADSSWNRPAGRSCTDVTRALPTPASRRCRCQRTTPRRVSREDCFGSGRSRRRRGGPGGSWRHQEAPWGAQPLLRDRPRTTSLAPLAVTEKGQ
jgi:hypothetical protein